MSFNGWNEVRLDDICESISITHSFNKEKLIFLNTSDVLEGKVLHINYSDIKEMPGQAKKSIKKDDILYSEIRPKNKRYAYINFEADDFVVSTKLMVIRAKSVVNSKFLYYYLTSNETLDYLQQVAEFRSGTFPQITFSQVAEITMSLPPIDEQKAIITIISAIDNKIELNNQMNKKLEEMTQAIFKSWFLDFEPFKDGEFEESELGIIPKGWKVGTISEFTVEMKNGGTPNRKNENFWNSQDIPWIKTGEICDSLIISSEEYISQEGLKNSSAKILPFNTVLIAMYGATAGKVGLLRFIASTNQACCAMVCNNANKSIYLYLYLLNNQTYIKSLAVGAAQQNLNKDTIANLKFLIPPSEVFQSITFEQIFNLIENNLKENQNLVKTRDSLLPKLMLGEIKVPIMEG